MSKKKEIKKFVRELKKNGWDVSVNAGHYRARHPETNKLLTFSCTPNCPFAVKHAREDIRKMEEGIY